MSSKNLRLVIPLAAALFVIVGIYGVATANFAPAAVQQDTVPIGAVMFFNLTECPADWEPLDDAKGRYLVGMWPGGELLKPVGDDLDDEENRAVGQHNHVLTESPHTHTLTDPGHSHVASSEKAIAIEDIYQDLHWHTTAAAEGGGAGDRIDHTGATDDMRYLPTNGMAPDIHVQEGPDGDGHVHEIHVESNTVGIAIADSTSGIQIDDAGTVADTNAPYLQLLVCVKTGGGQ